MSYLQPLLMSWQLDVVGKVLIKASLENIFSRQGTSPTTCKSWKTLIFQGSICRKSNKQQTNHIMDMSIYCFSSSQARKTCFMGTQLLYFRRKQCYV